MSITICREKNYSSLRGGGDKVDGGSLSGPSLPPSQLSLETANVQPFYLESNQLYPSSSHLFYSRISHSRRWCIGMGNHFPFPLEIISIGLLIHQIAVGTGLFLSAWSEWELSWIMMTMTAILLCCRKYQNCWGVSWHCSHYETTSKMGEERVILLRKVPELVCKPPIHT